MGQNGDPPGRLEDCAPCCERRCAEQRLDVLRAGLTRRRRLLGSCLLSKDGATLFPHSRDLLHGLVENAGLWSPEQSLEPHPASMTTLGKSSNLSGPQFPHQ